MLTLEIGVEMKGINGSLYRACSGEGKTHIISLVSGSSAVCTSPRLLLEYELRQVRVAAMPIVYRQHTASFINSLPVMEYGSRIGRLG